MSSVIGLEIGATTIRAVAVSGFGGRTTRSAEAVWDGTDAAAAIGTLQRELGRATQVGVAIGLPHLHVSYVDLPAAAFSDRESMLSLEPERYFATVETLTTSLAPRSSIAFGAPAEWLDKLTRQIETWGPITRVEAIPLALARSERSSVTVACEGGNVTVADGAIVSVRRAPIDADSVGSTARRHFAAAEAVARGVHDPLIGTLMRPIERRAVTSRRWRGVAVAAVAAVAGIVFCGAAWDQSRDRYLTALESVAAQRMEEVVPALEAQQRVALAQQEVALLTARVSEHSRVAVSLAAISSLLPRDVVVLNARASGADWQIDGTARDAAALVPLFDQDPRFDNVRTLAASTRFRDGNRTRESFSIALHVR